MDDIWISTNQHPNKEWIKGTDIHFNGRAEWAPLL